MIQQLNKQRSGWAALAASALIASVLTAGAVPAGAVTDRADHTARLSACVGDATADQLFTDVSPDHVFGGAINCIAYYEITQGTGDGTTYSPNRDVTRAQMAVFIARAAKAAGLDLDDVSDAGFSDIGETWQEAQDAINGLVSVGVILSGDNFRPEDPITRAEMATFLIGLLSKTTGKVSVSAGSRVLLTKGSITAEADDYFADAFAQVSDPFTRSAISALYELGVTRGTGSTPLTGDEQPGLDLFYSPEGTVDRGQMAAFITRALSHTGLRPRGVSAQYDGAEVVVSVRDASLRPVAGAVVDVFWVPTVDANGVFADDGTCARAFKADQSAGLCEIDEADPVTESGGEVTVAVTGLRRVPEGGAVVWAWTGQPDETVVRGTELYRLDIAEDADSGIASEALVTTTLSGSRARFGSSVAYTLQLRDIVGNVTHGVDGALPAQWILNVRTVDGNGNATDLPAQQLESDNSGEADFRIRVHDPNPGTSGDQVTATYTLAASDNAPPEYAIVHADGSPAATGSVIFSDAPGTIAQATATIETRDYLYVSGPSVFNVVAVTVLDQYGSPIPGTKVKVVTDNDGSLLTDEEFPVDRRGSYRFAYEYTGPGSEKETLTASYGSETADQSGGTATVYWADDAGRTGSQNVVAGDIRRREIVVDDDAPVMVAYDENDRFNVAGVPTTMADFEARLAAALRVGNQDLLTWSNYRVGQEDLIAEYSLG
ncbi:MAG: S-layer homology domain-containing protein [Acidimicrobiaceae bacterium]|nr:S-layer homology domain-containing protein [Acidimicrobiaceae bacterium]